MAHDVFISYASQDKVVADAICASLESRKIRCWIAPRDALPGKTYAEELNRAISNARVMVLIFSHFSNSSKQVLREVECAAVDNGIPIITFRTEDIQPAGAMSFYLKSLHWLDAMPPTAKKYLDLLAKDIGILLGSESKKPAATPSEERKTRPRKFSTRARVVSFIALLIAASFFALGHNQKWFFTGQPATQKIVIGGKEFLEGSVLLEMMAAVIKNDHPDLAMEKKHYLGNSRFLYDALKDNDIQIYAEYTGTLLAEHLSEPLSTFQDTTSHKPNEINKRLKAKGLVYLNSFGFENKYSLVMLRAVAGDDYLGIIRTDGQATITSLALASLKIGNRQLRLGSHSDFGRREDGALGLIKIYNLEFDQYHNFDHEENYKRLINRQVEVIDGYTTDWQLGDSRYIELVDDKNFFTHMWAGPLVNNDAVPEKVRKSLNKLEGKITANDMRGLLKEATLMFNPKNLKENDSEANEKLVLLVSNFLAKEGIIEVMAVAQTPFEPKEDIVEIVSPKAEKLLKRILIYEWQPPINKSQDVSGYQIQRRVEDGEPLEEIPTQKNRFTESKLVGEISWRVRAIFEEKEGKWSEWQYVEYYPNRWARICGRRKVKIGVGKLDNVFLTAFGTLSGPEVTLLKQLVQSECDTDEVEVERGAYIDWGPEFFKALKDEELDLDLLASRISITDQREEDYAITFTDPYVEYPQSIITLPETEIFRNGAFALKKLGAQKDTTNAKLARDLLTLLGIKGKEIFMTGAWKEPEPSIPADQPLLVLWAGAETDNDEVVALLEGKIDGIVADQPAAEDMRRRFPELSIFDVTSSLLPDIEDERIGFATRATDKSVWEALNRAIQNSKDTHIKEFLDKIAEDK